MQPTSHSDYHGTTAAEQFAEYQRIRTLLGPPLADYKSWFNVSLHVVSGLQEINIPWGATDIVPFCLAKAPELGKQYQPRELRRICMQLLHELLSAGATQPAAT